jgi:hypothetical protein
VSKPNFTEEAFIIVLFKVAGKYLVSVTKEMGVYGTPME